MKYSLNYSGHTFVTLEVEANSLEEAEKIAEDQLTEDETSEALDNLPHQTYWHLNFLAWDEGKRKHSVSYPDADDECDEEAEEEAK